MQRLRDNWPIIFLLILAFFLRVPLLDGSFWLDEAAQALESHRPLAQQLDIIPDFQPPLLHLMVHFALLVSSAEWWLRLVVAVVPGLVSIWGTYEIGRRLASRNIGLLSALLLATSSFHIFYSQELRPYALPMMWGVLSWLVLIASHQSLARSFKNFSFVSSLRIKWFSYSVITILGIFSSYLYPFLIIAQILWVVLWHREQLGKLITSLVLTGVCFAFWLPTFLQQLAAGGTVRQQLPGWEEVVSIPQLKALPLVLGKFIFGVVNLELTLPFVLGFSLLSVLVIVLGYSLFRQRSNINKATLYIFILWLVVPLISSWIISFWIPVVQPKRVLYLLPAFYLSLMTLGSQTQRKWSLGVLASVLLAINLITTRQYYLVPQYQRENWKALVTQLETKYPVTDTIAVFTFPEPYAPWRWYADPQIATLSTGTLNVRDLPNLGETLKPATNYTYIIVFDYLRDLSDPQDQLLTEIEMYGYQTVEIIDYPNIGFVRVYARPEVVVGYQL
jgi:mannosyltransferase